MVHLMGDQHHPPDCSHLDHEETLAVLQSDMPLDVKLRLVQRLWHGRRVTADERRGRMCAIPGGGQAVPDAGAPECQRPALRAEL